MCCRRSCSHSSNPPKHLLVSDSAYSDFLCCSSACPSSRRGSKNAIVKLLVELGAVCSKYQEKLRSLSAKRVQCHEIWSFVGSKEKSTTADKKGIVDLLN